MMNRLFTVILLLHGSILQAQQAGTITGTIIDTDKSELPGMTVVLSPLGKSTITDESGTFFFTSIPAGNYTITVSGIGFTARKENIQVSEKKITEINLQLDRSTNLLQEVTIRSARIGDRYTNETTMLATKTPTRQADIPQSVKVVGRRLIDDQQAINIQDVYKYASGISSPTPEGNPISRGFNTAAYINGARSQFLGSELQLSLVNVEQVEFLKGPSSILYGFASPGGILNVVTKKPLPVARYAASISGGSYGRFRTDADITGPLAANGKALYRLNIGYQSSPDYRPFIFNKNTTIAPAFTFKLSDKSTVDLQVTYNFVNKSTWYDWGVPPINKKLDAVPLTYSVHEPTDFVKWNNLGIQADFHHRFTEDLAFHSRAFFANSSNYGEIHTPDFWGPSATGDINRLFRIIDYNRNSQFLTNYITWKVKTGFLKHTLVAGIDAYQGFSGSNTQAASGTADGVPGINAFDPRYGQASISSYRLTTTGYGYENSRAQFVGSYLQDQIEILPFLKVILAGRYDVYRFKRYPQYKTVKNKPFIPSVAIVINPLKTTSLYAVISRGFEPQHTQDPMYGGPFDAQITEQWEVGAKNESFSGRLISSVAVYNVKRTNALVADPNNPPRLLQIGETTAKGFEFDIAGNVHRSLSIVANYSYNDIRITRTTQSNLGSRPTSQPYHLAGGFAKYTIASGIAKGLGIGVGASYASKGTHTSLQIPEYTTVDAALYYAFRNWNIGLNLYNVFDKRYYHSVGSSIQVYPGMPRNWMLRLGFAL